MRALREKEIPLVSALFNSAGIELSDSIRVRDMDDGGMGSLLFQPGSHVTEFGLAEKHFVDEDGVIVIAKLNGTREGKVAELDMWKTDFSPLVKWPKSVDINDGPPNKSRL